MELVAFNAYPDYEHGQFTVQLYHRKLPLYVTFVYVVFHYTGLELVARRGLRPVAGALATGLAIVLLDVPFDIVGVDAKWWIWHPSIHDVAQRWLGVPLTSYEWYLLFGAVLAWLLAVLRGRIEPLPVAAYVALAPVVAVAVIVLGIVGFLPFHAFEAIGVPDAALVAAHAAIALAVALRARGSSGAPSALRVIPPLLAVWHVAVLAWLWRSGDAERAGEKLAVLLAASTAMLILFVWSRKSASPLRERRTGGLADLLRRSSSATPTTPERRLPGSSPSPSLRSAHELALYIAFGEMLRCAAFVGRREFWG